MRIFVDADASPVQNEVLQICEEFELEAVFVKSYAHYSFDALPSFARVVYVDHGADAADYEIVRRVRAGDMVITQDYGLASLCLAKNVFVFHHKGFQYTHDNIDRMLAERHMSAQARKAGVRTKGPKAFTQEAKRTFYKRITAFIRSKQNGHERKLNGKE